MNKNQFFNKHKFQQIPQQELDRKWRVFNEQEMFNNMSAPVTVFGGAGITDTEPATDTQFLLGKVIGGGYPFNNLVRLRTDGSLYDFLNSPPASPSLNAFTTPPSSSLTYFTSVDDTPGLSGPFPTAFTLNTWNPNTGEIQTLTQTDGPAIPPYGSMSLHYRESNDTFLYLSNWYYGQLDYQIALYEIEVSDGSYTVAGVTEYESPNNSNQFMPVSIMDLGHVLEGGIKSIEFLTAFGSGPGPYTPHSTFIVPPSTDSDGESAMFEVTTNGDGYVNSVTIHQSGFGYIDGDTWTISGNVLGQIADIVEPFTDISGTFYTQQVPCLTSFYQIVPNGPGSATTTFVVELSPYDYTPVNNQFNTFQQLEIINHPWDSAKILFVIGTTQDPNGDIFFNLYCEKLDVTKDWPDNYIGDVFCVAQLNTRQSNTPQLEFQYEYQWADLDNTIYLGLSKPNI